MIRMGVIVRPEGCSDKQDSVDFDGLAVCPEEHERLCRDQEGRWNAAHAGGDG